MAQLRRPPGKTPEDRENQLISLAVDVAEQQMRDGTVSAQVLAHYLKLGSSRERLDQEKLQLEKKLLEARTEQIASEKNLEFLFKDAISAITQYQGRSTPKEDDVQES